MDNERVTVRSVRGRYPHHAARLDSNDIEAKAAEEGNLVVVRIDDNAHPEAWMEIVIEIQEP